MQVSHSTTRSLQQAAQALTQEEWEQEADTLPGSQIPEPAVFVTKFKDLDTNGLVSTSFVKALVEDMKLETITPVQSKTINEALKGMDILAQARTGTGKTIAFLLPLLQRIVSEDPSLLEKPNRSASRRSTKPDIRALIISPTRELAEQIAEEARKVIRRTGIKVQTAVGGTNKLEGLRKIQYEGCQVLVGTPGRLYDILSDPRSRVEVPGLNALVLDEADRLLDAGFGPEIEKIRRLLPDERQVPRQNLMFSATVPREILSLVKSIMKPGYEFVQTIQPGEAQTHERVPQKVVQTAGFENMTPALAELILRELKRERGETEMPFKAIVFFSASAEASLAHQIFRHLKKPDPANPFRNTTLVEMHARLTQQQRTRTSEVFRRAKSAIMFSSDVVARGMDFPNVSHVIQMGLPQTRDIYIHRLGRTGRSDKGGEGWLFVTPLESQELRYRLTKLPIKADSSIEAAKVDMTQDAELPISTAKTLTEVSDAAKMVDLDVKASAYKATLGVFQWFGNKQRLLDAMNNRAKYQWGMSHPPPVAPLLAQRLGIGHLQGINLRRGSDFDSPSPMNNSRFQRGGRPSFGSRSRFESPPSGYRSTRYNDEPRTGFMGSDRPQRMRFA